MSFKSLNFLLLKFTLFTLFTLTITRIAIVCCFGDFEQFINSELIDTFWLGFRFDLKLIATIALAVIYLPYLFLQRFISYNFLNRLLFILYLIITIASFVNWGYYLYFHSEFTTIFFGIVNDGTKEVIATIVSDYKLILLFIVTLLYIFLSYKLWIRYNLEIKAKSSSIKAFIYTIFMMLFIFAFARGSFGTFPLSKKTINIIDNNFLSNVTLNSIWQLSHAYENLKLDNFSSSKKILKRANVKEFNKLLEYSGLNSLKVKTKKDLFLEKNPPNIIFVLMEGWSSHIAMYDREDNNVLGAFSKHKNSDYFYLKFFSNGYGTNPTIEWLLLNSPLKDLSTSRANRVKLSTFSLRPYIKKGYDTIFLSGGSSSWRNHNRFWTQQGFNSYIGRATIERHYNIVCNNTWGVYDELLFKYLQEKLEGKSKKPIFSFVLTTNNHPPVELPKDFKAPKFNLGYYGYNSNNKDKESILKGYYYQSNALGKFLDWLKGSKFKDNTIVVATGDHIIKNFKSYNSKSELFFKYAVPLYIYTPKRYDKLKSVSKDIVGSHNDIFPTIYNLSLSNVTYYNFGTPLMNKSLTKAYGWNEYGAYLFNSGVVNSKDELYKFSKNYLLDNKAISPLKYQKRVIKEIIFQNYLKAYLLNKEVEE